MSSSDCATGQLRVGQALAHDPPHGLLEPLPLRVPADIEAEYRLVHIRRQVPVGGADVGALERPPEAVEEVLAPVDRDIVPDILFLGVVDGLVEVARRPNPRVGVRRVLQDPGTGR